MNPFLEWLNSLFKSKEMQAAPNQNPKYSYEQNNPTLKDLGKGGSMDVYEGTWQDRFRSPLADSLTELSASAYPRPELKFLYGNTGPLGYVELEDFQVPYGKEAHTRRFEPTAIAVSADPLNYKVPKRPYEDYLQAPASRQNTPRTVMIHEMGHLASTPFRSNWELGYTPETASAFFNNFEAPANPQYKKDFSGPQEQKAFRSVDPYYRTNAREAFSQAFVNAFEFLAETARDPKMDYRKFAGDLEANTPGMGLIIQDMLKLPLYKNHPLRGQIFTEKKK